MVALSVLLHDNVFFRAENLSHVLRPRRLEPVDHDAGGNRQGQGPDADQEHGKPDLSKAAERRATHRALEVIVVGGDERAPRRAARPPRLRRGVCERPPPLRRRQVQDKEAGQVGAESGNFVGEGPEVGQEGVGRTGVVVIARAGAGG